jgi:murein L,D-transpeptidase YcbB/YkuD
MVMLKLLRSKIAETKSGQNLLYFLLAITCFAFISARPVAHCVPVQHSEDTTSHSITKQIRLLKNDLNFPHTVQRFYKLKGNKLVWIFPDSVKAHNWEAMLMLDCIVQFGLNHNDYHPDQLLSIKMHDLISNYGKVSKDEKAVFDVLLTDAVLTFMNHLHYGKLNPFYSVKKIDAGIPGRFHADTSLLNAFLKPDFMSAVLSAQPHSRAYTIMQSTMRLITGQYVGDCYEVPEGQVRKIALNMERLRWTDLSGNKFIQVNVPSKVLKFQLPDTAYHFKVFTGSSAQPIPLMQSYINGFYFTGQSSENRLNTAKISFYLKNPGSIKLTGIAENNLLNRYKTASDKVDILMRESKKLATLLLASDGQKGVIKTLGNPGDPLHAKNFNLRNNIPLKITYFTCEVIDGQVVLYDDPYHLDKNLETALLGNVSH